MAAACWFPGSQISIHPLHLGENCFHTFSIKFSKSTLQEVTTEAGKNTIRVKITLQVVSPVYGLDNI